VLEKYSYGKFLSCSQSAFWCTVQRPISIILLSETPVISNKQKQCLMDMFKKAPTITVTTTARTKNNDTPCTTGTVHNLGSNECDQWWLLCTSSVLLFLLACYKRSYITYVYFHDLLLFSLAPIVNSLVSEIPMYLK
jgi:hypothetical protein